MLNFWISSFNCALLNSCHSTLTCLLGEHETAHLALGENIALFQAEVSWPIHFMAKIASFAEAFRFGGKEELWPCLDNS